MASGTINLSTDGVLTGKIEWSSTSNGSIANSSTITAVIYARRTDSYKTYGSEWSGYVNIGGIGASIPYSYKELGSSWVEMARTTRTIGHNNNGTLSVYIDGKVNGCAGTSLSGKTSSGGLSVAMDTIPRASDLTNITGLTMDGTMTFTANIKASEFTHTLNWYVNNKEYSSDITFDSSGTATKDFTATSIYYDSNNNPLWESNKAKQNVKFRLNTLSNGNVIGYSEKEVEIGLGSSYNPTLSNTFSITGYDETAWEQFEGKVILGKTKLVFSDVKDNAEAKFNATLSKIGVFIVGNQLTEDDITKDFTSDVINNYRTATNKVEVRTYVRDSRELQSSYVYNYYDYLNYGNPVISVFSAERDDDTPSTIKFNVSCSVYSLDQHNNKKAVLKLQRKDTNATRSVDISNHFTLDTTGEEDKYVIDGTIDVENCDEDTQYNVSIELTDYYNTYGITKSFIVPTAFQLMNYNVAGDGLAFGKVADNSLSNTIEIAESMTLLYHGDEVCTYAPDVYNETIQSDIDTYSCDYINSMNDYSYDETDTGKTWKDGKKIYRKILTTNTSSTSHTFTLDFNVSDIFIDFQHSFFKQGAYCLPFGIYGGSTDWNRIFSSPNSKQIIVQFGNVYTMNKELTVVIEYTKS